MEEKEIMKCDSCQIEMKIVDIREDGCKYYSCPKCGKTIGEETEDWFNKMGYKETKEQIDKIRKEKRW